MYTCIYDNTKSTKVQTLSASTTNTLCIYAMMLQPTSTTCTHIIIIHVKCERFHSAAEALVTAYLKEISNESCREASKTLIMKNHSVLRESARRAS